MVGHTGISLDPKQCIELFHEPTHELQSSIAIHL
jgi:hypothetical protein